ncbi:hypothetical protein ACFLWN_01900 [Chloroflexota bacterium]
MVEIRYKEFNEVTDLAGLSIAEARQQFKNELGIPDKAQARINGKKVNRELETETSICDEDTLTFAVARNRGAYMVAALLLALAVTGGVFAYGFVTASNPLTVTAKQADFAGVTANTTGSPTWEPYGFFKGSITGGPIFDVNTHKSQYAGNFVLTVSIANADQLVSCYRVLALKIDAIDGVGNPVDVNGTGTYDSANDYALLTLGNGSVDLFMGGAADNYTIRVISGFYVSHVWGSGWAGSPAPLLFAEVAQR